MIGGENSLVKYVKKDNRLSKKINRKDEPLLAELVKTMNIRQIGEMYGISPSRVSQLLKRNGIKARKNTYIITLLCAYCGKSFTRVDSARLKIRDQCRTCANTFLSRERYNLTKKTLMRRHEKAPCLICKVENGGRKNGLCLRCAQKAYYHSRLVKDPTFMQRNRERARAYYKTHRKEMIAKKVAWQRENREKQKKYQKEYREKKGIYTPSTTFIKYLTMQNEKI